MAVSPWSYNPRYLLNCKWHDWNIWNSYFLTLVEGFPMIFPRLTRSCKLWGLGSPLPLPHGGVWSGSDPIGLELLFRPQPWKVPRLMVRCHAFWWDFWRRWSKSCWSGLFFVFVWEAASITVSSYVSRNLTVHFRVPYHALSIPIHVPLDDVATTAHQNLPVLVRWLFLVSGWISPLHCFRFL